MRGIRDGTSSSARVAGNGGVMVDIGCSRRCGELMKNQILDAEAYYYHITQCLPIFTH